MDESTCFKDYDINDDGFNVDIPYAVVVDGSDVVPIDGSDVVPVDGSDVVSVVAVEIVVSTSVSSVDANVVRLCSVNSRIGKYSKLIRRMYLHVYYIKIVVTYVSNQIISIFSSCIPTSYT